MALRPLFAAIALLAAPAALAATVTSAPPASETATTSTVPRAAQSPRKTERARPGTPLKPRVLEAPGAALMMIPASYDPLQNGPFSRF